MKHKLNSRGPSDLTIDESADLALSSLARSEIKMNTFVLN